MYAVVETGGKQYKLAENDEFETERLKATKGGTVTLEQVLLIVDNGKIKVGDPYLKGASLVCEVVSHYKGKKVIVFKFRRRKNSKSKQGHRQALTRLKVKKIKLRSK